MPWLTGSMLTDASPTYYIMYTRGISPRWADARVGLAHARNDRERRKNEAVHATALPRGTLKVNNLRGTHLTGEGLGVYSCHVMPGRCLMTLASLCTMPGRSMLGFHRPTRHCLY